MEFSPSCQSHLRKKLLEFQNAIKIFKKHWKKYLWAMYVALSKHCHLISIIDCYDLQYIGPQHMTGRLKHFFPPGYYTFLQRYSCSTPKNSSYFYPKPQELKVELLAAKSSSYSAVNSRGKHLWVSWECVSLCRVGLRISISFL